MSHFGRRLRIVLSAAFAVGLFLTGGAALAGDGKLITPEEGTPEAALLAGLELIKDGKFDKWVDTLCHRGDLCYNDNSIKSLKKYNLPALKRLAGQCIKDGRKLRITRKDEMGDGYFKIFAECNPKGMPRPFHLKKEGKAWKFKKI